MSNFQVRQGDVYVQGVDSIPTDVKPYKMEGRKWVFAHGEVTGHSHSIYPDTVANVVDDIEMFESEDGTLWLKSNNTNTLKHEEHTEHVMPPGMYKIRRQFEYKPEGIEYVAD